MWLLQIFAHEKNYAVEAHAKNLLQSDDKELHYSKMKIP